MNKLWVRMTRKSSSIVGNEEWPYPIPVVKRGEGWFSIPRQGRKRSSTQNRPNELNASRCVWLCGCTAWIHTEGPDEDKLLEYARGLSVEKGKRMALLGVKREKNEAPLALNRQVPGGIHWEEALENEALSWVFYRILKLRARMHGGIRLCS